MNYELKNGYQLSVIGYQLRQNGQGGQIGRGERGINYEKNHYQPGQMKKEEGMTAVGGGGWDYGGRNFQEGKDRDSGDPSQRTDFGCRGTGRVV
jgi:hypothetical protein